MKEEEINRLKYRRQYLISPRPIICPFIHQSYNISDKYKLYSHVDLKVTELSEGTIKIVLLGDLFDYNYPEKDNLEILKDLIPYKFSEFIEKLSQYSGKYVLIYNTGNNNYLINDPASSRKVFYCQRNNEGYYASQPHLLAKVLNLSESKDPSKISFYHSDEFLLLDNANIGDTTIYDEIYQLIPNHYISLVDCSITRYWPNKKIVDRSLSEVVERGAEIIKGSVESIGKRYRMMLPITSGKDSRLLFAATRNIKNDVYYYINKHGKASENSHDVRVPKSLLKRLGLDFHVLDTDIEVDKDFEKIYFENNPYASKHFLPLIFNYYKYFPDKVNLPGIFITCGEEMVPLQNKPHDGLNYARLIQVSKYNYAIEYYSRWLEEAKGQCEDFNINIINLFYWEERIANWGTQTQLDKDIAQEDIVPYNSRELIELMLSIDDKYKQIPDYLVFREMTRVLWPEALKAPVNPHFKNRFLKFSKALGIMGLVKKIYYSKSDKSNYSF